MFFTVGEVSFENLDKISKKDKQIREFEKLKKSTKKKVQNYRIEPSKHAILRYMERIHGFDFTDLKVLYMTEMGYTSLSKVGDGPFYVWLKANVDEDLNVYKNELIQIVNRNLNLPVDGIYEFPYMKVVIEDNKIITVLEKETYENPDNIVRDAGSTMVA